MWFGQWVIGPPGSGKTTYCYAMQQMCTALHRPWIIINLDPANETLPYDVTADVKELVSVDEVMLTHGIGPNGALLYCMEYLLVNFQWLEDKLNQHKDSYVIFDCPGQVELYTHDKSMRSILEKLQKLDCRLTAAHLIDCSLCTEPHKYISGVLLCLSGMMLLELPQVNLLSKIDMLGTLKDQLDFSIDCYAEVDSISHIMQATFHKNYPSNNRFERLNALLGEILEDYNMVTLQPLDIYDSQSMIVALQKIDQGNGFAFGGTVDATRLFTAAMSGHDVPREFKYGPIKEKYWKNEEEDRIREV